MTRLRGEGRGKLLEVLNKEQQLLIEQAALLEKQVREGVRSQVEFKMFLAQNAMQLLALKTTAQLHKKAFEKEMVPEDRSKVRVEQEFSSIRMKEEEKRARNEEMREEERLKRKLKEENERAERERKAEEERIERNLKSAIEFKLNEDTITKGYRQDLDRALDELDALMKNAEMSEFVKNNKIERRKAEIESLNLIITAREQKAVNDEQTYL